MLSCLNMFAILPESYQMHWYYRLESLFRPLLTCLLFWPSLFRPVFYSDQYIIPTKIQKDILLEKYEVSWMSFTFTRLLSNQTNCLNTVSDTVEKADNAPLYALSHRHNVTCAENWGILQTSAKCRDPMFHTSNLCGCISMLVLSIFSNGLLHVLAMNQIFKMRPNMHV